MRRQPDHPAASSLQADRRFCYHTDNSNTMARGNKQTSQVGPERGCPARKVSIFLLFSYFTENPLEVVGTALERLQEVRIKLPSGYLGHNLHSRRM